MSRKMPFTVRVDVEADAAYILMTDRKVARTEDAGPSVMVDLDELGVVVGIEMLSIDAKIPFGDLVTKYHVHTADVELLRLLQPSIRVSLMQSGDGSSRQDTREGSPVRAKSVDA